MEYVITKSVKWECVNPNVIYNRFDLMWQREGEKFVLDICGGRKINMLHVL